MASLPSDRPTRDAGSALNVAPSAPGGALEEREAARCLVAAIETLQQRGARERHRELLHEAREHALRALLAAPPRGAAPPLRRAATTSARARSTLAKVYAALAEDALHGARQLAASAQRAPNVESCDAGWRRVEGIVASATQWAERAARAAAELEPGAPGYAAVARAASRAERAASAARELVEQRNHAYTFHTNYGFSFGEGWYLAAAAVLAKVLVQIEPGPGAVEAETFLAHAGLGERVRPYRSRPRAMKHVTEIVGRAFRSGPDAAQRRLRAAFLGTEPVAPHIAAWIDQRLPRSASEKKVLVWVRDGAHHPGRNTAYPELLELVKRARQARLEPVLIGDALRGGAVPEGAIDLILFWKDPIFRGPDRRRAQLQFFEHLRSAHGLVGQLGVTTAGMDGPALLGLPTLYLTDAPNVRMREWVGAVPGYREIVREEGYLDLVSELLAGWSSAPATR